ncbi:MAG TPA: PilZ domain-containing protein [Syntrophobacteria bacterium]|nr:PilZ domain-containing protein [Syntrophobacteria bacterium]
MERYEPKRKGLRAPVSFFVSCRRADGSAVKGRASNLSTQGLALQTSWPLLVGERVTAEFLVPDTLNSVVLTGEVAWCWSKRNEATPGSTAYAAGIRFLNLTEPFWSVVCRFCLKQLYDERLFRSGELRVLLAEVAGMSPKEKARALQILAGKRFVQAAGGLKIRDASL